MTNPAQFDSAPLFVYKRPHGMKTNLRIYKVKISAVLFLSSLIFFWDKNKLLITIILGAIVHNFDWDYTKIMIVYI